MYCDFKAEFSAAITPVRILRKSFWYADLKIKEHVLLLFMLKTAASYFCGKCNHLKN